MIFFTQTIIVLGQFFFLFQKLIQLLIKSNSLFPENIQFLLLLVIDILELIDIQFRFLQFFSKICNLYFHLFIFFGSTHMLAQLIAQLFQIFQFFFLQLLLQQRYCFFKLFMFQITNRFSVRRKRLMKIQFRL